MNIRVLLKELKSIGINAEIIADDGDYYYFKSVENDKEHYFALKKPVKSPIDLNSILEDVRPPDDPPKFFCTYHQDMTADEVVQYLENMTGIIAEVLYEDSKSFFLRHTGGTNRHNLSLPTFFAYDKPIALPFHYNSRRIDVKRPILPSDPISKATDKGAIELELSLLGLDKSIDAKVMITSYDSALLRVIDQVDSDGNYHYEDKLSWSSTSLRIGKNVDFPIPASIFHDNIVTASIHSKVDDHVIDKLSDAKYLTVGGAALENLQFLTQFNKLETLQFSGQFSKLPDMSHLKNLKRLSYQCQKQKIGYRNQVSMVDCDLPVPDALFDIQSTEVLIINTRITNLSFLRLENLKYLYCSRNTDLKKVNFEEIKDRDMVIRYSTKLSRGQSESHTYFTKTGQYLERVNICTKEGGICSKEPGYHAHDGFSPSIYYKHGVKSFEDPNYHIFSP